MSPPWRIASGASAGEVLRRARVRLRVGIRHRDDPRGSIRRSGIEADFLTSGGATLRSYHVATRSPVMPGGSAPLPA